MRPWKICSTLTTTFVVGGSLMPSLAQAQVASGLDCSTYPDGSVTCACFSSTGWDGPPGYQSPCCGAGYVDGVPNTVILPQGDCVPNGYSFTCLCEGPITTDTGTLSYYPLALVYAPPGNLSSVTYQNGTTLGTQTQIQSSSVGGVVTQLGGTAVQFSAQYQYGTINGTSFQFTSNSSWGPGQVSNADLIDHLQDTLWIWPSIQVTATSQNGSTSAQLTPTPGEVAVDLTMAQLSGLAPIPQYKLDMLPNLTAAEMAQLVMIDPFMATASGAITSTPTLDPTRFADLHWRYQVRGPDSAGTAPHSSNFDTSSSSVHGVITGYQTKSAFTVLFGTEVNFVFVKAQAQVGVSWEYDYQSTTQTNTGTITDAVGQLSSGTPCWHQMVSVYWDGAFGTYLFLPTDPGSASCTDSASSRGVVTDAQGNAVANTNVYAHMPDGSTWQTGTDVSGGFAFFDMPAGASPLIDADSGRVSIVSGAGKTASPFSVQSTSLSVDAGNSGSILVTTNGPAQPVQLSVLGLPAGVTAAYGNGGPTATIGTPFYVGIWPGADVPPQTVNATVVATGASTSAAASFQLQIGACVPLTCTEQSACGSVGDGCGGTLTCPGCTGGAVCNQHVCECPSGESWNSSANACMKTIHTCTGRFCI